MNKEPKPKSVFINQLDGGYTINLQGNQHYPVKVAVTIGEVGQIVNDFFTTAETLPVNAPELPLGTQEASESLGEVLS